MVKIGVLVSFFIFGFGNLWASDSDQDNGRVIPKIILAQDVPVNDFGEIYCPPQGRCLNTSFMDAQLFYQKFIQQLELPDYPYVMDTWRNLGALILAMETEAKTNPTMTPFERGIFFSKIGYVSSLLEPKGQEYHTLSFFSDALGCGALPDNLRYIVHEKMFQIYQSQHRYALALRHLTHKTLMNQNIDNVRFLYQYLNTYKNDVVNSFYVEHPILFLCDWCERREQIILTHHLYQVSDHTSLFYSSPFQQQKGMFYDRLFHEKTDGLHEGIEIDPEKCRIQAIVSYQRAVTMIHDMGFDLEEKIRHLHTYPPHRSQSI